MRLPGDATTKQTIAQMIRVNQAGEFGAKRIYAGQISVLKDPQDQEILKHMAQQEEAHLEFFNQELVARKIRPSIFTPIWNLLGYTLGATTAALGRNSAMICTDAVEEVINQHYSEQIDNLQHTEEKDLLKNIKKFREEELEHQQTAQNNIYSLSLRDKCLYHIIKFGCSLSIKLAKY